MARTSTVGDRPEGDPPDTGEADTSPPDSTQEDQTAAGRWLALLAVVLGLIMPVLHTLAVNFALPSIMQDIDPGKADLQWIIDAYTLTFASLMLAGGWLGDLFGRKRIFVWGLVLFILGSLAGGLSGSSDQLIAFRALQGVGAAMVLPGSLSILAATFRGKGRGAAMGVWAAVSALAVAAGPLVGGYITEYYTWDPIFLINIPVGIVALLLTAIVVRESKDRDLSRRVDLPGLVTGTAAVFFLVYALIAGASRGWTDDLILGSFGLAALLLIVFLIIEGKRRSPMVPLTLFRNSTFAASNVVSAAIFFVLFGTTLFLALYLQKERGFSSDETWVRLLPFAAAVLLISPLAGAVSERQGSRGLITVGCAIAAGGMALLLRTEPDSPYDTVVLPASIVLGTGMALTLGPMTTAVMGSADLRHAGVASGTNNIFRAFGGLLGIALLGAVVTSAFKNRLLTELVAAGIPSPDVQSIVDKTPANVAAGGGFVELFTEQMPPGTPGDLIDRVVIAAQRSFVDSAHTGMLIAVGFMLLAAMVAAIFVRSHVVTEPPVEQGLRDERRDYHREPIAVELEPAGPIQGPSHPVDTAAAFGEASRDDDTPVKTGLPMDKVQSEDESSSRETEEGIRRLLFELPFKAGAGSVHQNIVEFIERAIGYRREGLPNDAGGTTLPPGVSENLQARTSYDIAALSGYLLLERRFGRITQTTRPELAATMLIGAARALDLWTLEQDQAAVELEFVQGMVRMLLEGIGGPNEEVYGAQDRASASEELSIVSAPEARVMDLEVREVPEVPEVPEELEAQEGQTE
jgi:EmrB/QacA subfamily drug resistance transporter